MAVAQVLRDATFAAQVQEICDLYMRPLRPDEMVVFADEMTSLQPRPRKSETLATKKDRPTRVEHEYGRCGALNLFAAFDTRTGKVYGVTASRKRQSEFIAFLEQLNQEIPASVTTIHVVLDNLRMAQGEASAGVAGEAPAVRLPSPAGSLLVDEPSGAVVRDRCRRKRLRIADFAGKERLAERLMAFIREWNEIAHPFNWTSKSVAKVMAKCRIEDDSACREAA